jgi:signal transduction histidine kinase
MTARDDRSGVRSRGISSRGDVLEAVEVALLDTAGVIVKDQRGQARADREHLGLHDDRARIAIELHDHVVGQLFAVGWAWKGSSRSWTTPNCVAESRVTSPRSTRASAIRETIYHVRDA